MSVVAERQETGRTENEGRRTEVGETSIEDRESRTDSQVQKEVFENRIRSELIPILFRQGLLTEEDREDWENKITTFALGKFWEKIFDEDDEAYINWIEKMMNKDSLSWLSTIVQIYNVPVTVVLAHLARGSELQLAKGQTGWTGNKNN